MFDNEFCEIVVTPDLSLNFSVRVTLGDACRWEDGFLNPDMAERRGLTMLLEMYEAFVPFENAA